MVRRLREGEFIPQPSRVRLNEGEPTVIDLRRKAAAAAIEAIKSQMPLESKVVFKAPAFPDRAIMVVKGFHIVESALRKPDRNEDPTRVIRVEVQRQYPGGKVDTKYYAYVGLKPADKE